METSDNPVFLTVIEMIVTSVRNLSFGVVAVMNPDQNSDQKSGYRKVLYDEFRRRAARNRRYSIRGFARDLGVNPAQLVRVLNGTRNLSLRMAKKISGQLFSDKTARLNFVSLVELETTAENGVKIAERIAAMADFNHDVYRVDIQMMGKLTSWAHFAIVGLLGLKNAPHEISSIAAYLGLSEPTVQGIVDTLISCNLIEKTEDGLRKNHQYVECPDGVPNLFIQEYHRQMMDRARIALGTQDLNRRYFFGMTIGIAPEIYSELVEVTENYFRRVNEMARLSEKSAEKLYQVSLQIFDLRMG